MCIRDRYMGDDGDEEIVLYFEGDNNKPSPVSALPQLKWPPSPLSPQTPKSPNSPRSVISQRSQPMSPRQLIRFRPKFPGDDDHFSLEEEIEEKQDDDETPLLNELAAEFLSRKRTIGFFNGKLQALSLIHI
eukprot:TRINITY_DN21362_c0_g1_i1.p1 TRINITY_DN21362_c0_g1~~TRINITY_DN21362_c0_g1_i1.p1  ORF type:complete len:151 (-),score=43.15 TRINITY_DN21362_c0_g1_i1:40-435(-)